MKEEPSAIDPQRVAAPSPSQKERKAYAKAGQEILGKNMDPACWAMAVDHANGDQELAKSYYARWRSEELSLDIEDTDHKKEDLDTRRVNSFNRVRQTPRPQHIPAALRPCYGSLYWETLITVALMCSFVPLVLRFSALAPIQALLYTLLASITITVSLRITTRTLFKNKSAKIYRQLAASTACVLALTSLFVGCIILKSGRHTNSVNKSNIQVTPNGEDSQTSSSEAKTPTPVPETGGIATN